MAENTTFEPGLDADSSSPAASTHSGGSLADAHSDAPESGSLDFILDIPLEITVELGRSSMIIHDLLKLGQGSVIELSKVAGATMEVLANKKLIARGEVVSVNDNYGVRLTEIISPMERIKRLK